jgi:type I restriction enzyme S subunit
MRTFKELILPEFLLFLIKTKEFIEFGVKSFTGTAGQQRVNAQEIKRFVMGLPPLSEQKRIVQKVDQLLKLCDELELKIEENQNSSELLMEAVLKEAFTS